VRTLPELARCLERSTIMIGRMSADQLRRVIERPLPDQAAYEPGLVEHPQGCR
jgi:hypothetical protein